MTNTTPATTQLTETAAPATGALAIEELPSPNCDDRPADQKVDILVLHYTGMPDAGQALRRLRDPQSKVSAHYVIDEVGKIYRMVPEDKRAWHAGISAWKGERDIDRKSTRLNSSHSQISYAVFCLK